MNFEYLSNLVLQLREGLITDLINENTPPFVEVTLLTMFGFLPKIESITTHSITTGKALEPAYLSQLATVRNTTSALLPLAFTPNLIKYIKGGMGRNIIVKVDFKVIVISVAASNLNEAELIMNYWVRNISNEI